MCFGCPKINLEGACRSELISLASRLAPYSRRLKSLSLAQWSIRDLTPAEISTTARAVSLVVVKMEDPTFVKLHVPIEEDALIYLASCDNLEAFSYHADLHPWSDSFFHLPKNTGAFRALRSLDVRCGVGAARAVLSAVTTNKLSTLAIELCGSVELTEYRKLIAIVPRFPTLQNIRIALLAFHPAFQPCSIDDPSNLDDIFSPLLHIRSIQRCEFFGTPMVINPKVLDCFATAWPKLHLLSLRLPHGPLWHTTRTELEHVVRFVAKCPNLRHLSLEPIVPTTFIQTMGDIEPRQTAHLKSLAICPIAGGLLASHTSFLRTVFPFARLIC